MPAHFEVWYAVTWITYTLLLLGLFLAWRLDGLLATELFLLCELILLVTGVLFALDLFAYYVMLAIICAVAFIVGVYWLVLAIIARISAE